MVLLSDVLTLNDIDGCFGCPSDSDIGDYDYELSLEMKRQKIQRELMKLEQENLEKREEIVIKKDETPAKTRAGTMPKVGRRFY